MADIVLQLDAVAEPTLTMDAIYVQGAGGTSDHAELTHLDYEHAGHTGFQPTVADLDTIRSGAAAGASAVQPSAIADMATKSWVGSQGYITGVTWGEIGGKPSAFNPDIAGQTETSTISTSSAFAINASGANKRITFGNIVAALKVALASFWYQKPATGIPSSDMASAVQTSLGKADTALQEHQSLEAYRTSAAQDAIDAGKLPTSHASAADAHSSLFAAKQDAIADLETIRDGAGKGATSVQLSSSSNQEVDANSAVPLVLKNKQAAQHRSLIGFSTFADGAIGYLGVDSGSPVFVDTGSNFHQLQEQHATASASLSVAGWTDNQQTVSVAGVTASNTVIVSAAPADLAAYAAAGIYCSAQGAGTLTFACSTVPTAAIGIQAVIL